MVIDLTVLVETLMPSARISIIVSACVVGGTTRLFRSRSAFCTNGNRMFLKSVTLALVCLLESFE